MKLSIRGQSLIEYVALVLIVLGAFISMRIFLQRAFHERARETADTFGQGEQYEPGVTRITNYQ
ncbi:MAG: hypothetical protein NT060_04640 [Candidatus Omnitrophica bacterium]|nr:hypothetical protein [Candidatus Omnitrophota bacterium]